MKDGTENALIIHRIEDGITFVAGLLQIFAVDLRRGRHVEALFRLDEIVIMNASEGRFFIVLRLRVVNEETAGCAVGFVTDGKCECREAILLLSLTYDLNRLIS